MADKPVNAPARREAIRQFILSTADLYEALEAARSFIELEDDERRAERFKSNGNRHRAAILNARAALDKANPARKPREGTPNAK